MRFSLLIGLACVVLLPLQTVAQTSRPTTRPVTTQPVSNPVLPVGSQPVSPPTSKPIGQAAQLPGSRPTSLPASKPTTTSKTAKKPAVHLFPFMDNQDITHPRLYRTLADGVSAIQIKNPRYKKFIRLDRVGSVWSVTHPVLYPADKANVLRFIDTFLKFPIQKVVHTFPKTPSSKDLQAYKLHQAPYQLTLYWRGRTFQLSVVKKAYKQFLVYLPHRKMIVQTGRAPYYALDTTLYDLKRKNIFPVYSSKVIQLAMGCGVKHVMLIRKPKIGHPDQWWAEIPYQHTIKDTYRLSRLLVMMGYTKVNRYASHKGKYDFKKFGLGQPDCVLQLIWKGRSPLFYRFKRKDKYSLYVYSSYLNAVGLMSEFFVQEIQMILKGLKAKKK